MPGGETAIDEGVEGISCGGNGSFLGGTGVSEDLFASGKGSGDSVVHLTSESVEFTLEFSPGGVVGGVTSCLLFSNSVLHSLEGGDDGGFVLVLLGGDVGKEFLVVAVVGTIDVSLSVSESPDDLLDVPEELLAQVCDCLLI